MADVVSCSELRDHVEVEDVRTGEVDTLVDVVPAQPQRAAGARISWQLH
jgi:hypothetical protein